MSPDCFWFDTRGELGSGLRDGKIKEPQFFKSACMGIKGIYLTMKHGKKKKKCAYIEQCEDVSYRYSTSKGRASPKPPNKE